MLLLRRPAPPPPPPLLVGVDDDTVKWSAGPDQSLARYHDLGVGAVRIWIPWHGARRPSGVGVTYLERAEALAARGERVVLAIFGFARDAPVQPWAQRRFCRFARLALRGVPDARDVVVWNEANGRTYWPASVGAAAYASLLARCWDELHQERRDVNVIDSTASAHDPGRFLRRLGASYRASGRARPLVDTFGHNPYPAHSTEPPDARHVDGRIGQGDLPLLLRALRAGFRGTPQPLPGERGVTVWYLEDGFQSTVPPARRHGYRGRETEQAPAPPARQAELLAAAVQLADCQPLVGAFFNFELTDEDRLAGWQSGVLWRNGARKPAYETFHDAIAGTRDVRCG